MGSRTEVHGSGDVGSAHINDAVYEDTPTIQRVIVVFWFDEAQIEPSASLEGVVSKIGFAGP